MVTVTIFVEGGPSEGAPGVATAAALATYREGFRQLFSSLSTPYQLIVEPIGSISGARRYLEKIDREGIDGFVLIDLDGPPTVRTTRIAANYAGVNTANLYFMVQEMEAWILSQPDKIEYFSTQEGWSRKSPAVPLSDDTRLKGIDPNDISEPSDALDNVLRKYFEQTKTRGGKPHTRALRYHKTAHGPGMLALLDLSRLRGTFGDAEQIAIRLS